MADEARPGHQVHPAGVRIDDQQRNATVDELSAAVATGRLSADEFDERAELALRARTQADLDVLMDDLHAVARRDDSPVVALTAADLAKVVAFALVVGVIAWVAGGYAWPYQYEKRILLWLFGLGCGAAGAALRRRS